MYEDSFTLLNELRQVLFFKLKLNTREGTSYPEFIKFTIEDFLHQDSFSLLNVLH
jgi:hypothetical protein